MLLEDKDAEFCKQQRWKNMQGNSKEKKSDAVLLMSDKADLKIRNIFWAKERHFAMNKLDNWLRRFNPKFTPSNRDEIKAMLILFNYGRGSILVKCMRNINKVGHILEDKTGHNKLKNWINTKYVLWWQQN
jgi:hypothetical protein